MKTTWIRFSDQKPEIGQVILWKHKYANMAYIGDYTKDIYTGNATPDAFGNANPPDAWIPYPAEPEADEVTVTMTLRRGIEGKFMPNEAYLEVYSTGRIVTFPKDLDVEGDSIACAPTYAPMSSLTLPADAPQWAVTAIEKVKEYYK